ERAALREAEQKNLFRISDTFARKPGDQIEQRLVMNRYRIFGMKVSQPAKTKTQRPTRLSWFFDVLMKTLQRRNREILRRHLLGLAHHLPLVGAVTVQRN